ncbi:MAG: 1-acyl-sn-glycerol-3-phosphate acyltransferase [Balneolaceae bacterium]
MNQIKASLKVIAVVANTLLIYSVYAVGYLFIKLTKLNFEPWRNRCLTIWGKTSAKILSINVETKGDIPQPPFLLVSNHLSYVDIIILFSVLKTTFVAKLEVASWPVLGFIAKTIGIVFIDRKRKRDVKRVNKVISEQINERQGITIFPEGTTSPGASVLKFRAPLLEHAAAESIEVSYCAINYELASSDEPVHTTVCWWGDVSMFDHLFNLAKQKNINATITFGQSKETLSDRKKLAKSLHQKVSAIFEPMCISEDTSDYKPIEF